MALLLSMHERHSASKVPEHRNRTLAVFHNENSILITFSTCAFQFEPIVLQYLLQFNLSPDNYDTLRQHLDLYSFEKKIVDSSYLWNSRWIKPVSVNALKGEAFSGTQ